MTPTDEQLNRMAVEAFRTFSAFVRAGFSRNEATEFVKSMFLTGLDVSQGDE